ncbi:hypothetical protein ACH5RR_032211 [Cinchona calisaya]|uniref:F-box domain-containing protein n=1 Tax=Cinchona calisaya TaxID=153742 RepID=A0ABD2YLJ3_9GENT
MILQNLPFKYLIRFQCVSKSWKALFSDPLFMKARNRRQIIVTSFEPSVDTLDIEASEVPRLVEVKFPRTDDMFQVLGSCDGVLLSILDGLSLLLWNPGTRIFHKLPGIGSRDDTYVFYGFGYDESSDDYKVVRGNCYTDYLYDDDGNVDYSRRGKKREVHVYSRRSNSWKIVENCPYDEVLQVNGAYVDGFLYWLVYKKKGQELYKRIGSFDLAEQKFKVLPQPKFNGHILHLGDLEGFLCVVCNHYDSSPGGWTIWVMKEYGIRESWTKLIKIPIFVRTPFVIPLCIRKDQELVMQISDRKIVKYNPKKKEVQGSCCKEI